VPAGGAAPAARRKRRGPGRSPRPSLRNRPHAPVYRCSNRGSRGSSGACATDPYEVLGVRPNAAPEIIGAAYRALAKVHHPDAGGNAEEFKRVRAAYEQALQARTQ
jgi:DnaJ-domain-containing protein 1